LQMLEILIKLLFVQTLIMKRKEQ